MKDGWIVYNKSSENMSEVKSRSVDLIVVSPPYNIGTVYGDNMDRMSIEKYYEMMKSIMAECERVLQPEGRLLMDPADSVLMNGEKGMVYVQLAGMFQKMALDAGLFLHERHINFLHTESGVELPEDDRWLKMYMTDVSAHSNCHQWLVFSKKERPFIGGEIFYLNFKETLAHPCPFPDTVCEKFLDMYFRPGNTVLEPFMGTAKLGCHVLRRGGRYIGYEIDKRIYNYAVQQLASL
ncbi:MAG: site-specific DNA-methyltransferase [Parcubacteria group bacterium]|jgi:DNA modification methylase